jgi:hypothetical protein
MAFTGKKQGPASSSLQPTPAPTQDLKHGGQNYGQSQDQTPSSVAPGESVTSELGKNIAVDDPALDAVKSKGAKAADDNIQTRHVDATPLPAAHGLKNQSGTGAKVPPKTGFVDKPTTAYGSTPGSKSGV